MTEMRANAYYEIADSGGSYYVQALHEISPEEWAFLDLRRDMIITLQPARVTMTERLRDYILWQHCQAALEAFDASGEKGHRKFKVYFYPRILGVKIAESKPEPEWAWAWVGYSPALRRNRGFRVKQMVRSINFYFDIMNGKFE